MNERDLDLQLVRRVQQGDKRAYDLLVIKYQHKVASLIARYVRNASDVQDVSQEAFVKAYKGLAKFRGDSAFYTWLYRIAINTAKNYLTSQARRGKDNHIDAEEAEYYDGGEKLHEYASPERVLLTEEIKQTVNQVIKKLPEDLRAAVSLREFEGMSYEEIAVTMDCPVGTVRSRIFRAREAIDKAIKPLLSGHDKVE